MKKNMNNQNISHFTPNRYDINSQKINIISPINKSNNGESGQIKLKNISNEPRNSLKSFKFTDFDKNLSRIYSPSNILNGKAKSNYMILLERTPDKFSKSDDNNKSLNEASKSWSQKKKRTEKTYGNYKQNFFALALKLKNNLPDNHQGRNTLISEMFDEAFINDLQSEKWESFLREKLEY